MDDGNATVTLALQIDGGTLRVRLSGWKLEGFRIPHDPNHFPPDWGIGFAVDVLECSCGTPHHASAVAKIPWEAQGQWEADIHRQLDAGIIPRLRVTVE